MDGVGQQKIPEEGRAVSKKLLGLGWEWYWADNIMRVKMLRTQLFVAKYWFPFL